MERHAICFKVKPGSEETVRDLLANYSPPEWTTPDGARLLGTSVFMQDGLVVRFVEIDGSLPRVMAHLARQPAVQELERKLDEFLVEPRDMSSPDGARAFFQKALMDHVTTRVAVFEEQGA
ncbi:SchA/CurD-like domain-containing protein [Streptomyces sp. TRM64462]|uniref:SchA/CurD-like domain-containing protein n=1 Tax=Streptomyces sp. TRM64462 TaxID=2741726 RepID=UPI0015869C2A|nr:SchA/CurD-like domain-containing protein [Streptomyces sp. TRM64462]